MGRGRRDSLVQNIAANANSNTVGTLPELFDDQKLRDKLDELRKVVTIKAAAKKENKTLVVYEKLPVNDYSCYEEYLSCLNTKSLELQKVLDQTFQINQQLGDLVSKFNEISVQARHFKSTTNSVYTKYQEMESLHQTLSEELTYFENLDPVVRKLNRSVSANSVKKESFKQTLTKIDRSLEFLDAHPTYKDADSYKVRFKQCVIRACGLISNYLDNLLNNMHNDLKSQLSILSNGSASSTTKEALLYNKFATISEEHYTQVNIMVDRVTRKQNYNYSDELNAMLAECYERYFHMRMALLRPSIFVQLEKENKNGGEVRLVNFIQNNILFFSQLCEKEYELFIKFFPEDTGKDRANDWFQQVCEPLQEAVRTRVLRESSIPNLCEAITLLNSYYQFEDNSLEYEMRFGKIKFDKLFEPMLQDTQSRLVFRSQAYIDQKVVKYKPNKDAFVIKHRRDKNGIEKKELDPDDGALLGEFLKVYEVVDESGIISNPMQAIYPPLLYSLALLSKIYHLVNSSVFDDLAHHIVHDCIDSLKSAYQLLSETTRTRNLDIQLSYLSNLLVLRDQIQNFDIQYISNETYLDFSGISGLIHSIRGKSVRRTSAPSVLSLARETVPKVVNNMIDARSELLIEFRNLVKDSAESASKDIIENNLNYNSADEILEGNSKLTTAIHEQLPRVYSQLTSMVSDSRVVTHIFSEIQQLIITAYSEFYDKVISDVSAGKLDDTIISEIMNVDVFTDFVKSTASDICKSQEGSSGQSE
ncbi:HGL109Wp [Eremothecium sinecaudum]|uniref:Conserved oligomeric Golgi complex subunit 3 n=1 Tax=Eremothecium sinecaudum TaxID=45286 RepID=A0A109V034_9SACH|nr:HGL109Wp [Eremothecium sinecaudum]AMD22231.1 HGL109Wp [Eremothecium sinecaudum]